MPKAAPTLGLHFQNARCCKNWFSAFLQRSFSAKKVILHLVLSLLLGSCCLSGTCDSTLFWFYFIFFPFPAESESAGCVLLHTSRKVSRDAVWSIYFFDHLEAEKRILKCWGRGEVVSTGLNRRHVNASVLEFLCLSLNLKAMCCSFSKQFLCNTDCSTAFSPRQFLDMLIHHFLFCSCLQRDPSIHHRDSACWAPLEPKAETPNRHCCDLVSCLFQLIRSAFMRFSRS